MKHAAGVKRVRHRRRRVLAGRISGDSEMNALEERKAGEDEWQAADFLPRRINADQDTLEKDLARLVLTLVDLVRRLMERQAARRVNAGSLSEEQVERMGNVFLRLERKMTELRLVFGLEEEDLNLNLGTVEDLS